VAGCGTNQALITALRFPAATVIGSDLSSKSLDLCASVAAELAIPNLSLKQESINQADYESEYDYVICTGVIHHNARPETALAKLASALKPGGVLELMVYNRFHRITTSAFQKAIRILSDNPAAVDFDLDMSVAQKVLKAFPAQNLIAAYFKDYWEGDGSAYADALINPVEHTYTVESLEEMADMCGLEFLLPAVSLHDKFANRMSWNMQFGDDGLQKDYEALPDSRRWQVTNLLLFEQSPMLWFYLQRKDSDRTRKTEAQVGEEFLDTTFAKASAMQKNFILEEAGIYKESAEAVKYPRAVVDNSVKPFFDLVDGKKTMREIFRELSIRPTLLKTEHVRTRLTTPAFPYLLSLSMPNDPALNDMLERSTAIEELNDGFSF
jgi:SAM-dependent methyltransferase